ncbi:PRC and DUF2382 domain-containing protein [Streptomyces sp. H27-H1]|uniref:PRC and DUF2382 domain-containing protein n=1 Tax=Streptomyces sp. H27-H1 TaxID=2996461 RepID=UPI00226F6072|nr:PRC and DUF2382 domain-containing protein [Streptomyces sp. H27-H1]MCY0929071.1 PRC and DUF2382 domain-containing protein [Streptomyces sp. H27-H1]
MSAGNGFLSTEQLMTLTAYDAAGEKIGNIGQVYRDDATGQPEWVTVKTGLFGMKESFVPLSGARSDGEALHVPHSKDVVKDAPRVDADQHLDADEEHRLYQHYGIAGGNGNGNGHRTAVDAPGIATGTYVDDRGEGRGKDELIRSEERLRVGTANEEVGRARLKKVVVTENVTTTVPVSHEEVRVVREPIRAGERARGDIGEAEKEVTLHAERAVTRKETVPVERVRLETDKVTEQQEVSDTVRKEQIRYEDGKESRRGEGRGGPRR